MGLADRCRRLRVFAPAAFAFVLVWAAGPLVADASAYDLLYSKSTTRSAPLPLQGATVSGNVFVFTSPASGATSVRFWLDNIDRTGTPTKTENNAPHDFAGTNGDAQKTARPYDTHTLLNGTHTITVEIALSGGGTDVLTSSFAVNNVLDPPPPDGCTPAPCTFSIQYSSSPTRASPVLLDGRTVAGAAYIFGLPDSGANSVRFWLDNPTRTGTPIKTETTAPYDFAGTNGDGTARPYDTRQLANGGHLITIEVAKTGGGTEIATTSFTVSNTGPPPSGDSIQYSTTPDRSNPVTLNGSQVSGNIFAFVPNTGDITQVRFFIDNPQMTGTPFKTETGAPYDLAGSNGDGTAKPYNTLVLLNGNHTVTAAVDRASGTTVANATMTVSNGGTVCTPVPCADVLVDLPYLLDWNADHGGVQDKDNEATGFTWIDQPTNGAGYIKNNLDVTQGQLKIATTAGLQTRTVNSGDNVLAVGIDAPSQVTQLTTTLVDPPAGSGNFEQAGLWFGNDEKDYVKLVLLSSSIGSRINYAFEDNDVTAGSFNSTALNLGGQDVRLRLVADPTDRTIEGRYRVGNGPETTIGTFTVPGELFSFDGAGIDPEIGTRSFGGIFASHRDGPSQLTYTFDDFEATAQESPLEPGALQFNRTSYPITTPTSMVWGPDNRLYVSEMFGTIHALSFDANGQVIGDESITTIGARLTLGLTVDPLSTPGDVILWVSHSNPSTSEGQANSGMVSRLSGPSFGVRQDVITGLPRAIANHATNSIHFGPDGKLYIAQGGNTGAGAPNNSGTEFGTMAEQPLSAALLVADVRGENFDGSCNNTSDIFGPPPCDVTTYATGLRNTYDFAFHSNGSIYGPDNSLGVEGSFPPSPAPPCTGFASTDPWDQGGQNPGPQPDPLNRIVQGRYYGHPNPYRDECVYLDGSFQGVPALANYTPPIANLGNNRSANGTIEYLSDAFCGVLQGELLIANYSVGDDITRVRLSSDGLSVAASSRLIGVFNDPLPLAQAPDGRIFVGELGGGLVTTLTPVDLGCWESKQPLPAAVLDAGGAALGGKLYVVAGKTGSGPRSTVLSYDPSSDAWTPVADLPGAAVENPAVVPYNGKLYVFGGSTSPFSGAVTNAAAYDPDTDSWTSLPDMPVARGGPTAQAIGDKIYVVGGMDASGSSLDTMSVFDTTTNTWSTSVTSMGTRRDNPGSATFDGKLYVFGGRTRNADGTTPADTLGSVQMYDPATDTWTARASMPTARRTMVIGTLNGRAQVIGGEVTSNGGAFDASEEYDPTANTWRSLTPMTTPRHGAAAGTIGGKVYVAGGGPTGGFALTDAVEAFAFETP